MDERSLSYGVARSEDGKGHEDHEIGKDAERPPLTTEQLKDATRQEAAVLAAQYADVSTRLSEVRAKISPVDQAASSPELTTELNALSTEWDDLQGKMHEKIHELKALNNKAEGAEAGVDLVQREQQLKERTGKIREQLKAAQNAWAEQIKSWQDQQNKVQGAYEVSTVDGFTAVKASERARDKAQETEFEIGRLSLAYVAAQAELSAIGDGEWKSRASTEDWLPSTDISLPTYNDQWKKGGTMRWQGGEQRSTDGITTSSLAAQKNILKNNREWSADPANAGTKFPKNLEDIGV
jgi:hypothetical protein